MGIPIEIPPALVPNVNVSRGASFAVADATLLGAPVESVSPYNILHIICLLTHIELISFTRSFEIYSYISLLTPIIKSRLVLFIITYKDLLKINNLFCFNSNNNIDFFFLSDLVDFASTSEEIQSNESKLE